MKLKKANVILVLLIVFATFVCTSGVASAIWLDEKYTWQILVEYYDDNVSNSELAASKIADTTGKENISLPADAIPEKCPQGSCARNCGGCPCECECYNATLETVVGYRGCKLGDSLVSDTTLTKDYMGTASFYLDKDGITLNCNGHTIDGGGRSAAIYSSNDGVTIKNCVVVNNGRGGGISLTDSKGSTIKDNTVKSCLNAGIGTSRSNDITVTGNTVKSNKEDGIRVAASSDCRVIDNIANSNDREGISLPGSKDCVIEGDNFANSNGWSGICLIDSNNCTVSGSTAESNGDSGINLAESNGCEIKNNHASNNGWSGIELSAFYNSCRNNTITSNIASSNRMGIYLHGNPVCYNEISGNIVSNNSECGIMESYFHTSGNLIYNNYFDNTKNVEGGGTNVWNITKTLGTNIVGGPYLGGNYWSDYTGTDADGDGLGDTPYAIGGSKYEKDYLPLVKPEPKPTISIYTDKTSYTTGEKMHLGLDVKNPADYDQRVSAYIYLETPMGSDFTLIKRMVSLPAGLDYSNPNFKVFPLPAIPSGTYTWHAILDDPVTGAIISESEAEWEFVGAGVEEPIEIEEEIKEIAKTFPPTTEEIEFEE